MGSNNSRESRGPGSPLSPDSTQPHNGTGTSTSTATDRSQAHNVYGSRTPGRSRPDLSFLGIGSSSNTTTTQAVPERRETKQERERRKIEKEKAARIKERERSLKEEHVDGGFLVTMGVYTGIEDFNKAVVRQLMIERRIAPFWRGLEDFREDWAEHQLIAAARGLPVPKADEIPAESPAAEDKPDVAANATVQNLMVPITARSLSVGSETSTLSPSHPAFAPSTAPASPISSSPFRPRSKTLASLTTSKNSSSTDITQRETQLPKDPFVNGQAIEVFLYKDATECPICFLYYPPYLNKTRCCDQPICSECFVQIKRPDPHPPEHEHPDPSNPQPPPSEANVDPESLVSEPATCPYCQQSEFGVTFEPPPFRRGLAYASALSTFGAFSSAMSSSSSLNSPTGVTTHTHKRRTISISATASTVVTTDKVRPDWATKLANARNHLARRAAAATALHTAAYLMGNNTTEQRSFTFGSRSRFGRHRGESTPASGSATPALVTSESSRNIAEQGAEGRSETHASGNRRRTRIDDLEEMMMMEAIRLSLAAEEDRKRRAEKDASKDAKKRAKEEKKREKKEKKVYGSGQSSASGSALSLSLPGLGRRRGNSGASNLQNLVTPESVEPQDTKGKGIERSTTPSAPIEVPRAGGSARGSASGPKHLDTGALGSLGDAHLPAPSPTAPEKPSHLRQISNASSPASSYVESTPGSLRNEYHTHGTSSTIDTPNASGTNLDGDARGTNGGNGSASPESMFNFSSLVSKIGSDDAEDKEDAARHIEYLSGQSSSPPPKPTESTTNLEESVATLKVNNEPNGSADAAPPSTTEPLRSTPELMITPETPAAISHADQNSKQLGADWTGGVTREVTQ